MISKTTTTKRRSRLLAVTAVTLGAMMGLSACAAQPVPAGDADTLTVGIPGKLSSLYVGNEAGVLNYYVAALSQEGLVLSLIHI